MIRLISILFASTKRFPSPRTNNVATPFSRLESTPFLPPAVSHAKFGWELISTPPKPSLEQRRTSLSVFSSISWDIGPTFLLLHAESRIRQLRWMGLSLRAMAKLQSNPNDTGETTESCFLVFIFIFGLSLLIRDDHRIPGR